MTLKEVSDWWFGKFGESYIRDDSLGRAAAFLIAANGGHHVGSSGHGFILHAVGHHHPVSAGIDTIVDRDIQQF